MQGDVGIGRLHVYGMKNASANNKRIAKNTAFLYFRMFLLMAVTLYTSRIVLQALGVEDFGIYNVVGGVVAMFNLLVNTLSGASSRFITYALGKGDRAELEHVFSTVLNIHLFLTLLLVLLGETIGLWFVYNELVIPEERLKAALWVYHCSVLTAVVTFLSVPFNALIIAHERMSTFAYYSIIEVFLKLLIAIGVLYVPYDKLIVYAVLYFFVQFFVKFVYARYCFVHFSESQFRFFWDIVLVKKILVYVGWTLNGGLAVIGYTQGINILLNLFFGPVVNAARGITVQVQAAVNTFIENFQTAIRPQIVKSYAASEYHYMHTLVLASSKYGFFLTLLLVCPIMLCIQPILRFWLGEVPEHTDIFVRVVLLVSLLWPLRGAMIDSIHATGNIKKFQLYEGTSLLLTVPVAYILLKFWHVEPETVFFTYFVVEFITQILRVWIVLPQIKMPYLLYIQKVIYPVVLLLIVSFFPLFWFEVTVDEALGQMLLHILLFVSYILLCIWVLGLRKSERVVAINSVKKLFHSLAKK